MSVRPMLGMWGVVALCLVMSMPASADYRRGGHEGGEWKDEYRDGPCKVKIESKDDQYKEEVKCPDGRGANWRRGEWKDEYWERGCKVKIEAKRDEYKKEVKCDGDD
ncbi:Ig-like domain-containing protein [Pseudomonas jessenii]